MLFKNNQLYEGLFKQGIPHFIGQMIYSDGVIIRGDFVQGEPVYGEIINRGY